MISNKQSILFDLDDTLIHCNKYFILAIKNFVRDMQSWFEAYEISSREIKDKQLEIDLETVQKYGFASHHFPQSLVRTYRFFCEKYGRSDCEFEIDYLRKHGESVFKQNFEPYPLAKQTLQKLQNAGHELFLYTGGDPHIQEEKIKQMGLRDIFGSRIYVAKHKSQEDLEAIVKENRLDRGCTWMIGNSLRTDVLPALKAGIHAVHIPAEKEWKYNIVEIDIKPQGAFLTLPSIIKVPQAIESYRLNQLSTEKKNEFT